MNPLDSVECYFENICSQKSVPYKEKVVIDNVKCFKENNKDQGLRCYKTFILICQGSTEGRNQITNKFLLHRIS